jgi:hypothetical protein
MKKSYYFYLLILTLLVGGIFLSKRGNFFSSKPAFTPEELCELLQMNENQCAGMMHEKGFPMGENENTITYAMGYNVGWIAFNKVDIGKGYFWNFKSKKDYENYLNILKNYGLPPSNPVDIKKSYYNRVFKISNECEIRFRGFNRLTQTYELLICIPEAISE